MWYNENCQTMMNFCVHYTMETPLMLNKTWNDQVNKKLSTCPHAYAKFQLCIMWMKDHVKDDDRKGMVV